MNTPWKNDEKAGCVIAVVFLGAWALFWGAVIAIVVHFILKFW